MLARHVIGPTHLLVIGTAERVLPIGALLVGNAPEWCLGGIHVD